MSTDPIAVYTDSLTTQQAAVCAALRKGIDAALPKATARIWHAIPVWFIGENPVVGFHAKTSKVPVSLMFWNGQSFKEPALEAVGSFHAAQIKYADVTDVDAKALARWLKKAKADIWDLAGERKRKAKPKAKSMK